MPCGWKVTVGLASHWPCVTDSSGITTYRLMALGREMSTPPTLQYRSMAHFTFLMKKGRGCYVPDVVPFMVTHCKIIDRVPVTSC